MAFTQFTLDQSINQTRGIFDKYIYDTNDTIAQVKAVGYFALSRFRQKDEDGSMDWRGAIIDCECSDGFFIARVLPDGETVSNVADAGGFQGANEVTVDGGTYTVIGTETYIWALNSPTISFPGANTGPYPIIPIRTLSGTTTLAALAGTIEITTIANGAAVSMAARASVNGWFQII